MAEGNEFSVDLTRSHESQVKEFAALTSRLDAWWKQVEAAIPQSRPDLVPVLRNESGRPGWAYDGHNAEYANWRNWLAQRLAQLEKVIDRL